MKVTVEGNIRHFVKKGLVLTKNFEKKVIRISSMTAMYVLK